MVHSYEDLYIPVLLTKGTLPEHPGSAAVGLSPEMWVFMESCWQFDPSQRPSMSKIQSTIHDMLPPRDCESPIHWQACGYPYRYVLQHPGLSYKPLTYNLKPTSVIFHRRKVRRI